MVFQLAVTRWRLLSRVNRSIKGIAHVPVHACVCACVWKVLTYDRYSVSFRNNPGHHER